MKKTFVKPLAKRYALNTKENIVSSIHFADGTFGIAFHTIQTVNGVPATEEEGCYEILNNSYPIPSGQYITQTFGDYNYTINNVMATWDNFSDWYTDMKHLTGDAITSCHDK